MSVRQSIDIDLPIKEIFAYVSNLENLVEWSNPIIAVRKLSPGPIHVGATVRSTIRFLGRWWDMTFEVIECESGRSLTIKSIAGVTPCLFCYQFESKKDGRTTVSQEAAIQLTGSTLGLDEPTLTRLVSRQMEYDLLTLKDMLEASAPTYRSAS